MCLPSGELTYPLLKGIIKIFLCPRWDLLVRWMVVPWPPTWASRETQLSQDELLAKARAQMRFTRDSEELPCDFLERLKGPYLPGKTNMFPENPMVGRCISYWNSPLLRGHVSCRGCNIKRTWWYMKGGRMNGGIWGGTHSFMVIYFIFNIGNDCLHSRSK